MGVETLAMIAIGTTVLSTGMGVYQGIQSGKDAKAWSEYNAGVMVNEATMARQNAALEAEQQRKAGARLKGEQRAAFARAGVDISSGSPLDVLAETASETELAISTIKWAGEQQAKRAISAAEAERMKGKAAERASYWGAGSTFLTGASKATSMGLKYNQTYGTSGYGKKSSITEESLYD